MCLHSAEESSPRGSMMDLSHALAVKQEAGSKPDTGGTPTMAEFLARNCKAALAAAAKGAQFASKV